MCWQYKYNKQVYFLICNIKLKVKITELVFNWLRYKLPQKTKSLKVMIVRSINLRMNSIVKNKLINLNQDLKLIKLKTRLIK